MPKRYQISEDQAIKLEAARKNNKDKNVERRLKALLLRAAGKTNEEVGKVCEYHPAYVSKLVSIYRTDGISSIVDNHYSGNRRNMLIQEESAFLAGYKKLAEQGQIIEVSAIKITFSDTWRLGYNIPSSPSL